MFLCIFSQSPVKLFHTALVCHLGYVAPTGRPPPFVFSELWKRMCRQVLLPVFPPPTPKPCYIAPLVHALEGDALFLCFTSYVKLSPSRSAFIRHIVNMIGGLHFFFSITSVQLKRKCATILLLANAQLPPLATTTASLRHAKDALIRLQCRKSQATAKEGSESGHERVCIYRP